MSKCPRCGGIERRILTPNFFECTSQVLTGVVPRSPQGNPTEIPVYGVCGHQYQEGAAAASGGTKCSCGIFAVGECAQCGEPLCGQHGAHYYGGEFLCYEHGSAAKRREAEDREKAAQAASLRSRQELDEAKEAVERETASRYAAAPGFPTAPATGHELAGALETLVSEKKEKVLTRHKTLLRGAGYAEGWIFRVKLEQIPGEPRCIVEALIVLDDGRMFFDHLYNVVPHALPRDIVYFERGGPITTVDEDLLERVLDQVLHWNGVLDDCSVATVEQRRKVRFEGSTGRPSDVVLYREDEARRSALRT